MSKEEMISEIEIYLAHVVAKDFPFPKAVKLMYEEYKNSNKAWEKIYDEEQNYIGELNNKILDLEFKIKKQQKEIERKDKVFDDCKYTIIEYVKTAKDTMQKMEAMIEIEKDVINEFDKLLKGE